MTKQQIIHEINRAFLDEYKKADFWEKNYKESKEEGLKEQAELEYRTYREHRHAYTILSNLIDKISK